MDARSERNGDARSAGRSGDEREVDTARCGRLFAPLIVAALTIAAITYGWFSALYRLAIPLQARLFEVAEETASFRDHAGEASRRE